MKAHELEERLCIKQAKRLKNNQGQHNKPLRRAFMQFFTTSPLGLGITKANVGKRNNTNQSNFRSNLIETYNAAPADPKADVLWCPVSKQYHFSGSVIAAHIFAYHHGQETMTAIFGSESAADLFSPFNGMLMHTKAETMFDKGYFVIVPFIQTDSLTSNCSMTTDMIKSWQEKAPKEYRIRIASPKEPACPRIFPEIMAHHGKI